MAQRSHGASSHHDAETDRRRRELEASLAVERLLTESERILHDTDDLSRAVDQVLERVGGYFLADRSYVFEIRDGSVYNTHEWCAEGVAPQKDRLQGIDLVEGERMMSALLRGEAVVCENVEDIRDAYPREYELMRAQGISSYVEAPLEREGEVTGFIGLDNPSDLRDVNGIAPLLVSLAHLVSSSCQWQDLVRELRDVEQRYQMATEGAKIAVWEYDPRTHSISASGGAMRLLGMPDRIEDVPRSVLWQFDEEDRETVTEIFRQLDAGVRYITRELWTITSKEQAPCCMRFTYTNVLDDDGRPVKAYGVAQDVTASKRAEESYLQELANLREINDANLIAKGRHDLTRNEVIEYAPLNDKAQRIPVGTSYDAAAKAFSRMPSNEHDRACLAELVDRNHLIEAFKQGQTRFDFRYNRTKEGQGPSWVTTVISTSMSPGTGDIEAFIYSYDTTEEILRGQITKKLAMLGFDEVGVIYPKTDLCTSYRVSHEGGTKTHTLCYSVSTRQIADAYFTPERREEQVRSLDIHSIVADVDRAGQATRSIFTRSLDGEERVKRFQFSWLDDKRDAVFYCLSDETDQFEFEQRQISLLQDAKRLADQANAAKSDFLSRMSHDIRTPLNGIIGMTRIASEQDNSPETSSCLSKIDTSSHLLLALVNDILDLSKIEEGKVELHLEPYTAKEFFEYLDSVVRPSCEEKGIDLVVDGSGAKDDPIPIMDKLRTDQILFNLLSNAVKFTPAGGRVCYKVVGEPLGDGRMSVTMSVSDTGIGMSKEFQDKLFEPFTQEYHLGDRSRQGSGLGLAIVKRLVDLMGGTITVKSALGKGSEFTVRLVCDCMTPDEVKRVAAEPKGDDADFTSRRVLLCEDQPLNAEIARHLLEQRGMVVTVAEDGASGVRAFEESAFGFFDVVLMDLRMPVMDGLEATREIRALDRPDASGVPIVAMTADAFDEDVRKCLEAGMSGYVPKPIEPRQLYEVLSKSMGRSARSGT